MDAYEELRRQAAEKLDKAILAARQEYREAVEKIDSLRNDLGDVKPAKRRLRTLKPVTKLVHELYPRDRLFTIVDVLKLVENAEPDRDIARVAVKSAIVSLDRKKTIRRIAKDQRGHVLWADAALEVEEKPYATMSLPDVLAEVLEGRSEGMQERELVVAIRELGYHPDVDPSYLLA